MQLGRPARAIGWLVGAAATVAVALGASAAEAQETPTTTTSTTAPAGQTAVGGTLHQPDGSAVEGVVVVVSLDGDVVGEATSDADGRWSVTLPGAGNYSVTLDVGTLPSGVELRDPDRSTLDGIRVREGQTRPVLFQIGEREHVRTSRFDRLLDLAVDGIRFGLTIALAAVGLSLIFGVTGLVNFAHGDLVSFGALSAYLISVSGAVPELPLVVAALFAVALGGLLGAALERGLFAPLRRRRSGNVSLIVITIGLGLFLRYVFLIVFGGSPRPFDEYTIQSVYSVGPIDLRPKDWAVMAVAALVLAAIGVMLQRTRLGTAMRAVSDSRDLAAASGIDVDRVILATWVMGGALAALGGVLLGVSEAVAYDMGFILLLLMFAAVILGGIGTAYGALVGALVIGVGAQMSTYWISPKFRIGVGLAVLIAVIMFRPQGILGQRERVG